MSSPCGVSSQTGARRFEGARACLAVSTTTGSAAPLWSDFDPHPDRRPLVHPVRNVHRQVHAAVTHRGAKVIVPVRPVQRMPAIGEIHYVGHIRHVIGLPTDDTLHGL